MRLRFGTDGLRGVANRDLTPELLVALGRAVAEVLGHERPFLIGRDTRRSGPMVEAALVAGLTAAGADVELVGVLPTPGVAFLAAEADAPALVVSASHNPAVDNGVKVLARGGRKPEPADEARIEAALGASEPFQDRDVGTVREHVGGAGRYLLHLLDALDGRRLDGLHVVVDTANGAGFDVVPSALRELGCRVDVLHGAPDGTNINLGCGSTAPEDVRGAVVRLGADVGLALDGDADRVLAVDEAGALVDGDQLLAVLALDRHERGILVGDAVVVTVMSNLGLRRALADAGIAVVETPVGDRHVLAALAEHGLVLGGEQSGHLVVADRATTGDGALTGVLVLDVMARSGRRLSEVAAVVEPVPQVLRNVEVADPEQLAADEHFRAAVRAAESDLGDTGRVLVRPSGTEPVLRVMVEATDPDRATSLADGLVAAATADSS